MRRILMCHPSHNDGIAFYRTQGPLSQLYDHVRLFPFDQSRPEQVHSWDWYNLADILFISRPTASFHRILIEEAKMWGMKVWLDVDDLLDDIPEESAAYTTFMNRSAIEVFLHAVKAADVITTTTGYLKKKLEEKGAKEVVLIPNGLHNALLKFRMPWKRNNKVMWRGSDFHPQDLAVYSEVLLEVINRHPKLDFIFFGSTPFWLDRKFKHKNVSLARKANLMHYYPALCQINASCHYVILDDSPFNRAKSDLAWLDGTLAGSAMLVPDWGEWVKNGQLSRLHRGPQDFIQALENLIFTEDRFLSRMVEDSWSLIKEKYLLSKTNQIRLKIINEL